MKITNLSDEVIQHPRVADANAHLYSSKSIARHRYHICRVWYPSTSYP